MDKIKEIIAFGSRELDTNDEDDLNVIRELVRLGWAVYPESFNEDLRCVCINDPSQSWNLSGSQTANLSVAYDPARWTIG